MGCGAGRPGRDGACGAEGAAGAAALAPGRFARVMSVMRSQTFLWLGPLGVGSGGLAVKKGSWEGREPEAIGEDPVISKP